ncbi:hypothetical protein WN55_09667 [Dufourea novaeangliae]|uniref:LEM domain-containing protein n=1 Tax=Dufourea novaeangliae TaxID=178035 RepID=A0A154P0U8_DUFNO|nr:hypothetical protein WN55_09667 [Dufourea novaeangliae]
MSVDTLSDSELRSKLMEYGYPVGPVTQTTRKILVKKLKNLIETRGGTGSRHSLAARYSSEDTDDDSSSTVTKKKKTTGNARRQTLANPMPPPSAVLPHPDTTMSKSPAKEKTTHSEFKDPIVPDYDSSSTFTTRTVTKTTSKKYMKSNKSSNVGDGLETGSDSDVVEETNRSYSPSKYLSNVGKSHDRRGMYEDDHESISKSRSIHTIKDNKYNDSLFEANLSLIQSSKEDVSTKDSPNQRDLLANYETPFLSEFTRRLSSRSSINLPSGGSLCSLKSPTLRHTSNVPELKEKDSNGHFSSMRSLYSTTSPRYIFQFVDSNIPLCFVGADLEAPGVNCVMKENVDSVLQLLKRLQPILTKKAVSMICDNSSETPYLTDFEIMQMFTNNKVKSLEVKEDLQNAQLLVIKNPKWGISLVDISDDNGAPGDVLDSLVL